MNNTPLAVALCAFLSATCLAENPCPGGYGILLELHQDVDGDGRADWWLLVGESCGLGIVAEGWEDSAEDWANWTTAIEWLTGETSPLDDPPAPPATSPLQQCMDAAVAVCGQGCVLSVTVGPETCSFTCDTKSPCGPGTAPQKKPPATEA